MFVALVAFLTVAVTSQSPPAEPIFAAIQKADNKALVQLLLAGSKADVVNAEGMPAIMAATLWGDPGTVQILLDHGADPNKADSSGSTALMWAVPNRQKMIILLSHGANVNARSTTGRTPLLVVAAYPDTLDLVRMLVDKGTDLAARDQAGATALSLALRSSDVTVVRFLVERGLDPNTLSPAARRVAFSRYDLPTTDYLMSKISTPSPDLLGVAAIWQPTDVVARWIERGADVNEKLSAPHGRTILMNAVASEAASADTVRLLLERGAKPNESSAEGETALDWAIYRGDRAKIQALEQHGAIRGNGPRREEIPPPEKSSVTDARVSVTKSVARLVDVGSKFRDKTPCISCHHNSLPALASALARRKGIEVDAALERKNVSDVVTLFKNNMPRMMLGDTPSGGEALTAGYVLLTLAAQNYPSDTVTAAITHWLLARQMPDGRWLGNGINRAPSEFSTISHTAIAAGGLSAYPLPGRSKEIAEALRKAQQWVIAADSRSAEERAMRLMGLVWTKAPRDRVTAAVRQIREQQEPGGGWSQFGRTAPDAYATGLSLFALQLAGERTTDDSYRKGVAFLLSTQYPDGTWLVKSHSFPIQTYFESGFPFGRHQWISAAGTSWATLAIAHTLPDK